MKIRCRTIFLQFVHWRCAEDIRKKLIGLHASNKSKVTVSQMFLKEPYKSQESSSVETKKIIKESPDLAVILDFPAKLMGKKRLSQEKYKLLEEF